MRLAAIRIENNRRGEPAMAANIQLAPMINAILQDSRILIRFKGASPILPLATFVRQLCSQHGSILRS